MKNYIKSITAKPSQLKLNFDDGKSSKYMSYIQTLNYIYGYQLLNKKEVPVEPEDLICPEHELNTIISKLYEYFHTVLSAEIEYKFNDPQTQNNKLCFGFDVYGKSFITIKIQQ